MSRNKNYNIDNYWESSGYNSTMYQMYKNQIMNLAISRFKWVNLPKTCNQRFLEYTLLTQGIASIAYPKARPGMFLSLQLAQLSKPNIYYKPYKWNAIGMNGTRYFVNRKNGICVLDNSTMFPLMSSIDIYARELTDLMRTKQINRMHQKVPFIFVGPKERKGDMLNIYKQIAGNEPAVIANDGITDISTYAIEQTKVEYIAQPLYEDIKNTWAEIYNLLGINNQTFKEERMIEDEVKTNNAPTTLAALSYLNCRREACQEFNERFSEYLPNGPIDCIFAQDNKSENYNFMNTISNLLEGDENNGNTVSDS